MLTEDQHRIAEKRELIADTLEYLREVLTAPMTLQEIREQMPDAPRALKDWIHVWWMQGHVDRRRDGKRFVYSLKGR